MIGIILVSAASIIAAYLLGSLNFAIIISRAVRGEDIRELGNRNPGASNTGRVMGKFWGISVMILDILKAIGPMAVARIAFFDSGSPLDDGVLYMMGIAAVLGHIFPVWYGFKGGGGVSTMTAVSLWFVPVEFLATMLICGFIALAFMRGKGYWLTQWTPIFFVTLTPFVTLIVNRFVHIPIWKGLSIGGHSWAVVAGGFALSLILMGLNMKLLAGLFTGRRGGLRWEKD